MAPGPDTACKVISFGLSHVAEIKVNFNCYAKKLLNFFLKFDVVVEPSTVNYR